MKKLKKLASYWMVLCLLGLLSCSDRREVVTEVALGANSQLVSHPRSGLKKDLLHSAAEEFNFFTFLQNLTTRPDTIENLALENAAALYFPDSTFHTGYHLYGLEISYLDSIRLLYYEFSKNNPIESHGYLGAFNKAGKVLDILSLKEAMNDGNSAVNLVDGQTLELEYYGVYDEEGYQEDALVFEYYQLNEQGRFQQLSRPIHVSDQRLYFEASLRLLSQAELERYRPKELELMKREIEAEYGKKFKASKWQDYFDQQYWYTPRYEKVTHLYSDLERLNLQKIAALQKAY